MRAVAQGRYGDVDVLECKDIAVPEPGEGQVLVQVCAAGVGPDVWHLMTGRPYLVRLLGFGLCRPRVGVRGRDVAGRVAAVGAGVTGFRVGDEVLGTCEGSFAEYAVARVDQLAVKPGGVSFAEAAAVPISGGTALQGLRMGGESLAGQRVLVIGAGGGVGSFAVQLAKGMGARVTGMCGPERVELVRSLGVDAVIDRSRGEVTDGGPYDLILDTAGLRSLRRLRRALAPKGILVIVGGEGGGRLLGGIGRVVRATLLSPFVSQRLCGLISTERGADYRELGELVERGRLRPVVDRVFGLAEAAEAVRYAHSGRACGKVVLSV